MLSQLNIFIQKSAYLILQVTLLNMENEQYLHIGDPLLRDINSKRLCLNFIKPKVIL